MQVLHESERLTQYFAILSLPDSAAHVANVEGPRLHGIEVHSMSLRAT